MRILSVLFLMFFVPQVYAQESVCGGSCAKDIPTCETLGYKQGMYCPEGYTVCPYDSSYVWCKTYSCEDAGFFSTAGADTEKKINLGYVCRKTEYHGLTCFDCSECEADPKLCRYSNANKGEGVLEGTQCCNGYYTGCKQTCNTKDKSKTVPAGEGVLKKTETCSSCGVEEIVVTGWECDVAGGYQLSADGKSCVEMPCPTPTEQPDVLYQEGNVSCDLNRWYVDSINYYRKTCSRCLPNACETGYSTDATCADTKGYEIVEQGYSGNDSCKKCVEKTCNTGYSTNYQSIADCQVSSAEGWTADKAWTWTEDAQNGSGELKCGKCTPKSCPTDYSENISCSNGYTIEDSTEGFYGDKTCGKCVASICSDGAKTDLTVDKCGYSGLIGASVKETGELSGGKACQKCECASSDCTFNSSNKGEYGNLSNRCCNGNYKDCTPNVGSARNVKYYSGPSDVHAKTFNFIGACGEVYFIITECEDGYKKDGNYCVQKTCADYGLKSNQNSCDEGFKAVNSTEHLGCYQCVAKTCADYDSTWKLDNGAYCPTGYKKAYHTGQMLGNSQQTCYDCNSCQELSGYISVSSESDIPSYVTAMNVQLSCEQPKYCATGCADGYTLSGCSCQSASCGDGYYATSTPMMAYGNKGYYTPSNVAHARRGASLYLRCQSGDNYLYKFDQCNQTQDFMSETDCYKKTNGSDGWDWSSSDGLCGTCTAKDCPTDYSKDYQSIADCPTSNASGWTATKAWTFSAHSNQYAGELKCGNCTAKSCSGGYSVSATCDESSYTTAYSSDYFNGTNLCKKCVARSCPKGTGTGLTVSQCNYPATYGASVVPSGSKSGKDDCLECSCSASDCIFDSSNKGVGTLSDQCCNGRYKSCTPNVGNGRNISGYSGPSDVQAKTFNLIGACGEVYFIITECDEGYKLEDNVCIEKPCSDYGLKSSDTACGDGYKAVASTGHPGCYECQAKTCADYDMQPTNSCSTGYTASSADKKLGSQTKTCYKCDQCEEWTGYKSSTQNYWSAWNTKYSCTTPKYCATKCTAGYDGPSSCDCTIHSCGDGYVAMNDARKVSDDYYTDSTGASLYTRCQSGDNYLYKFDRCAADYMSKTDCHKKTNGSNGWTWTDMNSHGCGTCVAKSCPLGYTDVLTSEKCGCGQEYVQDTTTYAGEKVCGKCEEIYCGTGYNAKGTSFEKDGINYGPISYWTGSN